MQVFLQEITGTEQRGSGLDDLPVGWTTFSQKAQGSHKTRDKLTLPRSPQQHQMTAVWMPMEGGRDPVEPAKAT